MCLFCVDGCVYVCLRLWGVCVYVPVVRLGLIACVCYEVHVSVNQRTLSSVSGNDICR